VFPVVVFQNGQGINAGPVPTSHLAGIECIGGFEPILRAFSDCIEAICARPQRSGTTGSATEREKCTDVVRIDFERALLWCA
jgi:hypothetical protein